MRMAFLHLQTIKSMGGDLTETSATVFVVDDDPSVRRGLERLLKSAGFAARTFTSAEDFLQQERPNLPCCLVLDVRMPGMSGLELQKHLAAPGNEIPIIFITAHEDERAVAEAMTAGAVAFLHKPVNDQALIDVVRTALHQEPSGADDRGSQ